MYPGVVCTNFVTNLEPVLLKDRAMYTIRVVFEIPIQAYKVRRLILDLRLFRTNHWWGEESYDGLFQ